MMKLYAFSDEADSRLDFQIKALTENGLDGMEIRSVDGINIADMTQEQARIIKERMDLAGLRIRTVGSPIGKIEVHRAAEHIEVCKHVLALAKILGAERVRVFSLYIPQSECAEAHTETVLSFLREIVSLAREYGITLCHENEKGIFGDIPSRCVLLHQAIPELGAIFDPANYMQCGVDAWQAWNMLKPYVKYLHIKDVDRNGRVVPAGKGEGRLPQIIEEYIRSGGDMVTVEPHLTVFEGFDALENGAKSQVSEEYVYPSCRAAFDAAVDACKGLIGE